MLEMFNREQVDDPTRKDMYLFLSSKVQSLESKSYSESFFRFKNQKTQIFPIYHTQKYAYPNRHLKDSLMGHILLLKNKDCMSRIVLNTYLTLDHMYAISK